jgi:hypothetical protein
MVLSRDDHAAAPYVIGAACVVVTITGRVSGAAVEAGRVNAAAFLWASAHLRRPGGRDISDNCARTEFSN